jgi:hypothetical protein
MNEARALPSGISQSAVMLADGNRKIRSGTCEATCAWTLETQIKRDE